MFSDEVAEIRNREIPEEWRARQEIIDGETRVTTGLIPPVANDTELLRQFGYDPEDIEVIGTINQWRKEQPDGSFLVSYYFRHRPRQSLLDLPALYAASRRKPKPPIAGPSGDSVTVVVLSDAQVGKTGARGGTPELLDRLREKRAALDALLKKRRPSSLVLVEAGDLFENFESGGSPLFTNDLSLAQQMDVAGTELYEFISLMARYGHVDVVAVTSNHTAWRRGKQELGRPGDDLGLFVHKQVSKVTQAAGIDATWTIPAEHDDAVVLDVMGTGLGVTHGHRIPRGKVVDWWARQQHGGQPVGSADILVTGHYHFLTIIPTGRNPYTKRTKWWIQAPTLDNGSDWFRNRQGDDSDPGLLVFDIGNEGFSLQSLVVL